MRLAMIAAALVIGLAAAPVSAATDAAAMKQRIATFLDRDLDMLKPNGYAPYFDTENGFLLLPDDYDEPITTKEALDAYVKRIQTAVLDGTLVESKIEHVVPLGPGYWAAYTTTRANAYRKDQNGGKGLYHEFRTAWVLREKGDSFKIVYSVEAPLGPIPYMRKMRALMGPAFEAEQKAKGNLPTMQPAR
jgi:hypothetical protein